MGKYATKSTDDDGNEIWHSSDGKEYKTRAGAWKRSKSLEEEEVVTEQGEQPEPTVKVEVEPEVVVDETSSTDASWATFSDFEYDDSAEIIPAPLKRIRPAAKSRSKMSKKELEAQKQTNMAILKIGYRTADHLLTKYRRVMLDDPDASPITHAEQDYDWISGITEEALAENGLSIGMAIGPTQIAVVANGYWFGAPIVRINAESDKSPFKGATGGRIGRFLERLPVVGKWIKNRRRPEITIEDFAGDSE